MDKSFIPAFLKHDVTQPSNGWPVGITQEGILFCQEVARSYLSYYDFVDVEDMVNEIKKRDDAPDCVAECQQPELLAHCALLSVGAVMCYAATGKH